MILFFIFLYSFDSCDCPPEQLCAFPMRVPRRTRRERRIRLQEERLRKARLKNNTPINVFIFAWCMREGGGGLHVTMVTKSYNYVDLCLDGANRHRMCSEKYPFDNEPNAWPFKNRPCIGLKTSVCAYLLQLRCCWLWCLRGETGTPVGSHTDRKWKLICDRKWLEHLIFRCSLLEVGSHCIVPSCTCLGACARVPTYTPNI